MSRLLPSPRARAPSGVALPSLLTVAPTRRELGGAQARAALTRAEIVGIGPCAGERAAILLDTAPCRLLLSLGFAGGLDPRLQAGDVVAANAFLDGTRAALPAGTPASRAAALLRQSGVAIVEGAALTVDEPLLAPQAKRRAYEESGALVVDMEGSRIAEAATARGVPFIALRAVVDEADFALPKFVAAIVADQGRREWRHAARGLWSPSEARRFLPLALRSRKAALALRRAANRILPALAQL